MFSLISLVVAVRVGRREWRASSRIGSVLGLAVDGRARAEHDASCSRARCIASASVDQAADVVGVVARAAAATLSPTALQGREVDHGLDRPAREHVVERGAIADVGARRSVETSAPSAASRLQHLGRAVGEVVDADDLEAGGLQRQPGVRADVAGRAGQQNHVASPPSRRGRGCRRARIAAYPPVLSS